MRFVYFLCLSKESRQKETTLSASASGRSVRRAGNGKLLPLGLSSGSSDMPLLLGVSHRFVHDAAPKGNISATREGVNVFTEGWHKRLGWTNYFKCDSLGCSFG